jgi:hypothetical protein
MKRNPRKSACCPDWKEIIVAGPDWPQGLVIPKNDPIPEGSECVQDSMFTNEHWEWELWRQPDGRRYFLVVIRKDIEEFVVPRPPGVALTVPETFQFLMTNLMPAIVLSDLTKRLPTFLQDIINDTMPPAGQN